MAKPKKQRKAIRVEPMDFLVDFDENQVKINCESSKINLMNQYNILRVIANKIIIWSHIWHHCIDKTAALAETVIIITKLMLTKLKWQMSSDDNLVLVPIQHLPIGLTELSLDFGSKNHFRKGKIKSFFDTEIVRIVRFPLSYLNISSSLRTVQSRSKKTGAPSV